MSDSEVTDAPVSQSTMSFQDKTLGRVKWFNNKVGYGFITTCDESPKDVFVHHSSISVQTQQYKYLVEGEYVHFTLSASTNTDHENLAKEVTGINGGKLMCETRNMNAENRASSEDAEQTTGRRGQGRRHGSHRGFDSKQARTMRRSQEEEGGQEV